MAAGKTVIGQRLAKLLQRDFFDTDQLLMQKFQMNIVQMFQNFGIDFFRQQEEQVLAQAAMHNGIVLATGGGSILSAHSRSMLQAHGTVCYLQASPMAQLARLKHDQTRPLLPPHPQRLAVLQELARARNYLYASIADIILDTENLGIDQLVLQLASLLQEDAYN